MSISQELGQLTGHMTKQARNPQHIPNPDTARQHLGPQQKDDHGNVQNLPGITGNLADLLPVSGVGSQRFQRSSGPEWRGTQWEGQSSNHSPSLLDRRFTEVQPARLQSPLSELARHAAGGAPEKVHVGNISRHIRQELIDNLIEAYGGYTGGYQTGSSVPGIGYPE